MPDVATVQSVIRSRLEANFTAIPLRWKNETSDLPDTPTAYAFVELVLDLPEIIAFGGGRGANLQRTTGRIEAQVLVPAGTGTNDGLTYAEQICAVFRGQSLSSVSYFAAQAIPGTGKTEDGNYDHSATAVIELFFDQAA